MDDFVDLVLVFLFLLIGVYNVPSLIEQANRPIVYSIDDKTALRTDGFVESDSVMQTGSDLFLSLLIIDEYTPFPRSIKINDSPIIDLDKQWVANKYINISQIYNPSGSYRLGSMLDWVIEKEEYETNNGDPYIHYVLREVH